MSNYNFRTMKRLLSFLFIALFAIAFAACNKDSDESGNTTNQDPDNKTLVVYYTYTNNCEQITESLTSQISADIVKIEPAEKGIKYEDDNYAVTTEQIDRILAHPESEKSYPAVDDVNVDFNKYNTIIIVVPLWWKQMATPMQSFLFRYGANFKGKNVGLIVSSNSSDIIEVEKDCKRLIPEENVNYFRESLWINSRTHPARESLITEWLTNIEYSSIENASK